MVPRIVVEEIEPNVRMYNVNTEITEDPCQTFWRPLRETSRVYLEKLGEIGSDLVKQLFNIAGVEQLSIEPYRLKIEIGKAFEWEEINPTVIKILSQYLMDCFGTQWVGLDYELSEELPSTEEKPEEDEEVES